MKSINILHQVLQSVGVDPFSCRLYEYLLNDRQNQEYFGSSGITKMKINVLQLSREFGVGRNIIYSSLIVLEQYDLIEFLDDSRNTFILNSIEVIKAKLLQKEFEAKKLVKNFDHYLPDILNTHESLNRKSYVTKLEGENNFVYYINKLSQEVKAGSNVIIFSEGEDFYKKDVLHYLFKVWQRQRLKKQVTIQVLLKQNNISFLPHIKNNKEDLRQTKILPSVVDSMSCYWVVGNEVILFDTALDRVIGIKDVAIAEMHSQMFNQVWNNLT